MRLSDFAKPQAASEYHFLNFRRAAYPPATINPTNPMTRLAGSGVFCGVTVGPEHISGGGGVVGGGGMNGSGGGCGTTTGGGFAGGGTSPPLTPVGGGGGGKNACAAVVTQIAVKMPAIATMRKRRVILDFMAGPSSVGAGRRGFGRPHFFPRLPGRE